MGDINQSDILNNSNHIYNIVLEYFKYGMENNLKRVEKITSVRKYKDRLSFLSIRTVEMQQFREKVSTMIKN